MITIDLVTGEVTTSEVNIKQDRPKPEASAPRFPQPAVQPAVVPVSPAATPMPGGLVHADIGHFIDKMQK